MLLSAKNLKKVLLFWKKDHIPFQYLDLKQVSKTSDQTEPHPVGTTITSISTVR